MILNLSSLRLDIKNLRSVIVLLKAIKGDWVEIEEVLLEAGRRAPQVSEDTQNTPLMQWIKGQLEEPEAELGDIVSIKTLAGRIVKGKLSTINPSYAHSFGPPIKELVDVGNELQEELKNL